jgi:DNA-binding protein HU-beta
LAEEHQLTKRAGEALLGELVSMITKHLKKGERVRIVGLGILQVRKRAARMGRNPATGVAIKIKASKKESRISGSQGFEDGGLTRLPVLILPRQ